MNKLKCKKILSVLIFCFLLCGFSYSIPKKEPVIFVHGIMGNSFSNGDHRVWPPRIYGERCFKALIYSTKVFSDVKYLSFNDKGEPLYKLEMMNENDDNILFNEYYKKMKDVINNTGKYQFYYFPYDWRMPCKYNGDKLKVFIEDLARNKGYNKVNIVGYSMGGLVTLEALESLDKNLINKVITLSTPYLGSPKSIYSISTGNIGTDIGDKIMSLKLNSMIKNFSSIYDLFPSKDYRDCYIETTMDRGSNKLLSFKDVNDFLNNEKFINEEVYSKCTNTKDDRINKVLKATKENKYYFIVGSGVGTIGKLNFKKDVLSEKYKLHDFELVDGDGEVPNDSLNLNNLIPQNNILYTNVAHENMSRNTYVINKIIDILDDKPIDFMRGSNMRAAMEGQLTLKEPLKTNKIKISVEGKNLDKINVHLYDSNNVHTGFVKKGLYEKNISYSSIFINEDSIMMSAMEGKYLLKLCSDEALSISIKISCYDGDNSKTLEKVLENVNLDKKGTKSFNIDRTNIEFVR